MSRTVSRREMLAMGSSAAACVWALPAPVWAAPPTAAKPRFRLGACDWSIGKRADLGAIELTARMGLDGVEVSFGEPGGLYDLRKKSVQKQYLEEAAKHNIQISSLAMGVLNDVPLASDPRAERWVAECIEVMHQMGVSTVLLAFFGQGDINGKPVLQKEVVQRLKRLAPAAEKAGVVLGIESWLSADNLQEIIDAVGSSAVKVYLDIANVMTMKYNIYQEISQLGRESIRQIHAKEYGVRLGEGKIDFPRIRSALDDIEWDGWLIIEGAVDKKLGIYESYAHNQKFLRNLFGE